MGDLDKKWEQEQENWENARDNLSGSRDIGCKKWEIGRFRPPPIEDLISSQMSYYELLKKSYLILFWDPNGR